jgi:hypothetical protein
MSKEKIIIEANNKEEKSKSDGKENKKMKFIL